MQFVDALAREERERPGRVAKRVRLRKHAVPHRLPLIGAAHV